MKDYEQNLIIYLSHLRPSYFNCRRVFLFVYTVSSDNIGWVLGTRLHASSEADINNFMEGLVTAVSSTQVTIAVDSIGGSGTKADWVIAISGVKGDTGSQGIQGVKGDTGATGANVDTTRSSTTSLLIQIGSKTFVYSASSANLGWAIGTRLRAASAANATNYMEGLVTAVSSTQVTINVDAIGGSGTKTDWNIFIIGAVGSPDPFVSITSLMGGIY